MHELNNYLLLWTDDQIVLLHSGDVSLRALYTLGNNTNQFVVAISPVKHKVMVFKEQVPVRNKTVIDNTILEQMNMFTYLAYKILYEEGKDKL
jgi:hypothetical protein